jgi:hypothetical protein
MGKLDMSTLSSIHYPVWSSLRNMQTVLPLAALPLEAADRGGVQGRGALPPSPP